MFGCDSCSTALAQILLRGGEILFLQRSETNRTFEDGAEFIVELGEVGVAHALRLRRIGQASKPFWPYCMAEVDILRGISATLRSHVAVIIGEQRQGTNVVGIGLKHAVRGVNGLLGIAGLLIGAHQRHQRVFLHDGVRVGLQESLDGLSFGGGVRLLHRVDVRVVFSRILNLRLLSSRGLTCRLLGHGSRHCKDQQHDY